MMSEPMKALRERAERAEKALEEARHHLSELLRGGEFAAFIEGMAMPLAAAKELDVARAFLDSPEAWLGHRAAKVSASGPAPVLCGCVSPAGNICNRPKGHTETHRSASNRWWHNTEADKAAKR